MNKLREEMREGIPLNIMDAGTVVYVSAQSDDLSAINRVAAALEQEKYNVTIWSAPNGKKHSLAGEKRHAR